MDMEVAYIWTSPNWSVVKALYFIMRCGTYVDIYLDIIVQLFPSLSEDEEGIVEGWHDGSSGVFVPQALIYIHKPENKETYTPETVESPQSESNDYHMVKIRKSSQATK
ncbi:hypothetical protein BDQ17DRAFT_1338449 [Cyathus striatus]|nr:hypothetical protein BDQ17DRAFT_1338449 [Cyathus striatus]